MSNQVAKTSLLFLLLIYFTSGKNAPVGAHTKANMFSHVIMADVKNGNQHLHFTDNLKYSENLPFEWSNMYPNFSLLFSS